MAAILTKKVAIFLIGMNFFFLCSCGGEVRRDENKIERNMVFDSVFNYFYVETMTKDSLFGIENISKETIIPPIFHKVWFDHNKYKKTISPSFVCERRNKAKNIYALYDTLGNVIIPLDKGYNFIVPQDNFIICGYYKGVKWYQDDGRETDIYNCAIYDGSGMLKIDTNEGFDYFGKAPMLEIEIEEDKPLKQNYIKSNYMVGLRPIVEGDIILGHTYSYFNLVTWEPVFTESNGSLNGSEYTCSAELICRNGFFKFSNGQYICVYDKNKECIIPYDRHYKTIYDVKQGIYSYFIVGFDEDCWGICDKYGTEIVSPSYKYKNRLGICFIKGEGFRYSPEHDAHILSDCEIWELTEKMNAYLDELSVGYTL